LLSDLTLRVISMPGLEDSGFDYIQCRMGEVLYKPGDTDKNIYMLMMGRIVETEGDRTISEYTREGDIFGESAALYNRPRSTKAVSVMNSTVMVVRDLLKAMGEIPSLGIRLGSAMAERLYQVTQKYTDAKSDLLKCVEQYESILKGIESIYGRYTEHPGLLAIIEENKKYIPYEDEDAYFILYAPTAERYDEHDEKKKHFSAGEVLFFEGDLSKEVYILLEGKLGVRRSDKIVAVIDGKGSFVGDMSILRNEPRSATVEVIENALLLVIDDLEGTIRKTPAIGVKLIHTLANRIHNTAEKTRRYIGEFRDYRQRYSSMVKSLIELYQSSLRLPQLADVIKKAKNSLYYIPSM
ncbi:MAG: Crp/Fnr family transcriptional regulator, partial [bacterium]